jgi:hypothetical protein
MSVNTSVNLGWKPARSWAVLIRHSVSDHFVEAEMLKGEEVPLDLVCLIESA